MEAKESSPLQVVCRLLAAAGRRSRLRPPWDNLAAEESLFDLPATDDQLVKRLRKKFEDSVLAQTGVLSFGAEGSAALNSPLAADRSFILAVRNSRREQLADLLLGTGETLSGASGLATSLAEVKTSRQIWAKGGSLFVAATAEDRAVLRSLGAPVVPVQALDGLRGTEIALLQRLLGDGLIFSWKQRKPGRKPKYVERIRLVFVNWSPARLDVADVSAALDVAAQLRQLDGELKLGLPLHNIRVWKPSSCWLEQIRLRLAHGCEHDVIRDLAQIDADCRRLSSGASPFRSAETSEPLSGPRTAAAAEWSAA